MSAPADMTPGDMTPGDMTPDDTLAMDYALGALGREQRRDVERRLRSDPAFLALVEGWQAMLAPLDDETRPVPAPPALWQSIADELAPASVPHTPTREPAARSSLWNSLALWRGLAVAGLVAAIIAFAQFDRTPLPGAPPKLLVAALAGPDGKPFLSAAYDSMRGAVVITPAAKDGDARATDQDIQLWVIEGEKPPRSLGIIDIKGPNAYAISSQRLKGVQPGAVLAISIEPRGGSPTGQPTGPVIATGKLSAI